MPARTLTPDLLPSAEQPAAAALSGLAAPAAGPTAPAAGPAWTELPGLRLIKVPDAAPPYDCETHGAACPAMRDTAGAGPHGTGQSRGSIGPRRAAALAGKPFAGPGAAEGASVASGKAAWQAAAAVPAAAAAETGAAAEAGVWPQQFAQMIVEILAGSRSPRQIIPLTTDRARRQFGVLAPFLASDQRPKIRRVVTSRPSAGVIEMTVVASFGPRSRALAMRFEHMPSRAAAPGLPARPARWLCTDLEAG